ncbi:uncharacterized protein [Tursiops truncatus]|uniref:uncharacterized protein n=1 Tax=Tursiops truncatus TaxID=9739 RepID=UPI003CCFD92A
MRPAEGSSRAGRPLPLRRCHRKCAVRPSQRDPGRAPSPAQAGFWRPHRLLLGVLPVVGAEPGSVGVSRDARGSGGSWRCGGVPRPGGGFCQQPIGRPLVPRPPGPAAHPEPLLLAVLLPPTPGLTVQLQQPLQSRLLLRRAHARRPPVPARGLGPRGLRGSGGLGTFPPPPEGAREPHGAAQLLLRGARASSRAPKRVRIAQQARMPWESCGALPLLGTTTCYMPASQACLPAADPIFLILPAKDHLRGTCTPSSSKPPGEAQEQEGTGFQSPQSLIRTPALCPCVPVQPHNMHLTFLLLRLILFSSSLVSDSKTK